MFASRSLLPSAALLAARAAAKAYSGDGPSVYQYSGEQYLSSELKYQFDNGGIWVNVIAEASCKFKEGEFPIASNSNVSSCFQVKEDPSQQFVCFSFSYFTGRTMKVEITEASSADPSGGTDLCTIRIEPSNGGKIVTMEEVTNCNKVTMDLEKDLDIDENSWRARLSFNDTASSASVAQAYYDLATQDMNGLYTSASYDTGTESSFGSWTNQIFV